MAKLSYKKISEHAELAEKPAVGDEVLVNDASATETKRVSFQNLCHGITAAQITNETITSAKIAFMKDNFVGIYFIMIYIDGTAGRVYDGWSTEKLSTGVYKITHNLGSNQYCVLATGGPNIIVGQHNLGDNSVELHCNTGGADGNMNDSSVFAILFLIDF